MGQVSLMIGGRAHSVACRDGEEAALVELGRRLDVHAAVAARAAGGGGAERTMLFVALMLADELVEAERTGTPGDGADLSALALRLEQLADSLENGDGNA